MSSSEGQWIKECDALIERGQFDEALAFLKNTDGITNSYLNGKVRLAKAQTISRDFMFQHYASQEAKLFYRCLVSEAYDYLFLTVMNLTEANSYFREYANKYIWWQLGQAENELARTTIWIVQEEEEEDVEKEDSSWADPDNLLDHINHLRL